MTEKVLIDGLEYFDGEAVNAYELKLTGAYPMDAIDAAALSNGDTLTLLVTVRLQDPKFSRTRKHGLKRTNTAKVEDLVSLDKNEAKFLYDSIGRSVDGINVELQYEPPPISGPEENNLQLEVM